MVLIKGMQLGTFARAATVDLRPIPRPQHVFICIADHFEPDWKNASHATQQERVERWVGGYAASVDSIADSRGRPPQHTFFLPIEQYLEKLTERIASLVRSGFGDVEVHLHHDNDDGERLARFLTDATLRLHERHGLLSRDRLGQLRYGFIHGNWALDNSHPDGRWCGVNNELTILRETGCYADFTMPAAPHPAQTRMINSIYYAQDDPNAPKSHDAGLPARVGHPPPPDTLMMIQGPLSVLTLRNRFRPRVENANIAAGQPPTARRLASWLRANVAVQEHEHWQFIKLHTHGAQEDNAAVLLGEPMRDFHMQLREYARQREFKYYYVTAREMAHLVSQAESGREAPDFDRLSW